MRTWAADGTGLGTTTRVVVTDPRAAEPAARLLERQVAGLDGAASRFRDDSQLSAANRCAGRPVRIGVLLRDVLEECLRLAAATEGLVDPTVGAAVVAAGYDRPFDQLPATVGCAPVPGPVGGTWRDLHLEPDDDGAWLVVPAGCRLDLGAVAKAWLADRVAADASRDLGCGVLVDLGGDLAAAGRPPVGGWLVGMPEAAGDRTDEIVRLDEGGLATSGQGRRRWATHHGPAHHVIDPRTGRPARTPWWTVTVHAQTCAEANAAATAAMVLAGAAPDWLAERGLPARLVARDGTARLVGRWPAPAGELR